MSSQPSCPSCGQTFPQEDFCPHHGLPLVFAAAGDETPDAAPATQAETVPPAAPEPAPAQTADGRDPGATADGDAGGPAKESAAQRISQFMARMGLRSKNGGEPPRQAPPAPPADPSPLPDGVTDTGWRLAGPLETRVGGIDRWPVEKTEPSGLVRAHFHRYRSGALTRDQTYGRLAAMEPQPGRLRVWHHGTADLGNARCDYELVSLPSSADMGADGGAEVGLDQWLADSAPSEQRALHLLPALIQLLQRLDQDGIHPLVLDPSQLVWLSDGTLCLSIAGALEETGGGDHYRADAARNALLAHDWSAPELVQTHMVSDNAAVFSIGQLLAHAVWGQCCSHRELMTGAVPFHTVADGRLARVLMGCLWPSAQGRWSVGALVQAGACGSADAMPQTRPWASLAPGSASTAFSFAGGSYWRLDDLMAVASQPAHWPEATQNIAAILDWLDDSAWSGQARLLRDALAGGRSADWALVALLRAIRPDAPLTWRGLDLCDQEAARSLVGLAQRALRGGPADEATVRDLFRSDLRGAFSAAPTRAHLQQ